MKNLIVIGHPDKKSFCYNGILKTLTRELRKHKKKEQVKSQITKEFIETEGKQKLVRNLMQNNVQLGNTRIGGTTKIESQKVLEDRVRQWSTGQKKPWLVDVEADEKVDYGSIVPIIARLKELNVNEFF